MKALFALRMTHLGLLASLGIYCLPAWPACTSSDATTCASTLTDSPLPVASSVQPNILFMIDDSGSMGHIVPDSPYDPNTTYLNCTSVFPDGATSVVGAKNASSEYQIRIKKSDGTTQVGRNNANWTTYNSGANTCFSPNLFYRATSINASDCSSSTYCQSDSGLGDVIYSGNYLNWYLCSNPGSGCTTAANFGANATRKPGTQSRLEIVKSAAKSVIGGLGNVRVGLAGYTSDDGGTLKVQIADLNPATPTSPTQLSKLNTAIDAISNGGFTPLAETLSDIGRYFTLGYTGNLKLHPAATTPTNVSVSNVFNSHSITNSTGVSTLANPVTAWCQKNFTILMTDGLPTKDQNISSYLKEYYGYGCNSASNCTGSDGKRIKMVDASGALTAIDEYYDVNESSDYLDDVANALFDIDLRPDLVPSSGVKTTKSNVTIYTIGFADPMLDQTSLLRRAAQYGGGLSLTAGNAAALVAAFQAATDDILAKDGSAAAVAVANAHVTNTNNASYATSYNSGTWTGDLIAYPINTNTGAPEINNPIWNTGCTNPTALVDPTDSTKGVLGCSAQVQLDLKSPSSRVVFTSNDTSTSTCRYNCGIPFEPNSAAGTAGVDKISAAQKTRLSTPAASPEDGDAIVNYIRGDRTGETAGTYRTRAHILGDTVNAEPVVVSEPSYNYSDLGYSADYCSDGTTTCTTKTSAFRTLKENRPSIIIQPANDGMVHAFNALTGAEEWAYIPDLLISSENDPANASKSILNTRSRKASFNHYYMIDATPVVGDVDFDKTGSTPAGTSPTPAPDWRTIVVGGLGKGGSGYYALDVTTTTGVTESAANAATKVLWEFPRSISDSTARANATANLGYTFGKPIITKTAAAGWVVLVTSGYNNGVDTGQNTLSGSTPTYDSGGDGYGHLYVINPKTGDLIKDIATPQCNTAVTASTANSKLYPCGLTHINGYVEDRDLDNTTTYVYGGDLYGNVWRFDLTGSSTSSWSVTKLAILREGSTGTAVQPVTSVPELAKVESPQSSGIYYYYVYVGTGQYLDRTDLPCPPSPATCAWTPGDNVTQKQSMYGLIDPRPTSPGAGPILPDPLRTNLQTQTFTTSGTNKTLTTTSIALTGSGAKKGWVLDYTGGERIVTDPTLAAGALVYTTNIPSTEVCTAGGSSWLYAVDYLNGGQTDSASWAGKFLGNILASRPVLIQTPDGKIYALTRTSDGKTISTQVPVPVTADVGRRVSWRELFDK